jgi:mannose-6-phosphate isomerase-like protein (cupin superfamily)
MSAEKAVPFSLRGTPLVSAGNVHTLLAKAPALWAHIKVYAEGGENGVHAHPREDHLFLVLSGEATFVDAEGNQTVVPRFDGMMIPRGVAYAFRSSAEENLVMLRVGSPAAQVEGAEGEVASDEIPLGVAERVGPDGRPAPGLDPANKTGAVAGVPIPGRFFGT